MTNPQRASIAAVAALVLLAALFLLMRHGGGDEKAGGALDAPTETIADALQPGEDLGDAPASDLPTPETGAHDEADAEHAHDDAAADDATRLQEDADEEEGTLAILRGRVLDPAEAAGVPDALVTIYEWEMGFQRGIGYGGEALFQRSHPFDSVRTDSDGRFEFALDRPFYFGMDARAEGFATVSALVNQRSVHTTIREGVAIHEIDLTMREETPLYGRVVDGEGRSVEGASVRVERSFLMFGPHGRTPAPRGMKALTEADGKFSFRGYSDRLGGATLFVDHDAFAPAQLLLERDMEMPLEIVLSREGVGFRGRVVTFGGHEPVSGATVEFMPKGDDIAMMSLMINPPARTAVTDEEGEYEIRGLMPAEYSIFARYGDLHSIQENGGAFLIIPKNEEEMRELPDLLIHPGYLVEGQVLDALTGEPIPSAEVYAQWDASTGGEVSTRSDREGHYMLGPLYGRSSYEGRQELILRARASGYAHVVPGGRGGESDITLRLEPERFLYEHDIELSPMVRLSGTVRHPTGTSLPDIQVRAFGDGVAHAPWQISDRRGRFELTVPARATVQAEAQGDGYVTSFSKPVHTGDDDVEGVEVVMDVGANLRILVQDEEGQPVEGASVSVMRRIFEQRSSSADVHEAGQTDSRGLVELQSLISGSGIPRHPFNRAQYAISARKEGWIPSTEIHHDVPAGETSTVEITLRRGEPDLVIAGIVVDEEGEPFEGATVTARRPRQPGHQATTGSDGRFRIEGLYDDDYHVEANVGRTGSHAALGRIPAGSEDLEIVLLRDRSRLVIRLHTEDNIHFTTPARVIPLNDAFEDVQEVRQNGYAAAIMNLEPGTTVRFRVEAEGFASEERTFEMPDDASREYMEMTLQPLTE